MTFLATSYPGGILALGIFLVGILLFAVAAFLAAAALVQLLLFRNSPSRFVHAFHSAACFSLVTFATSSAWVLFSEVTSGTQVVPALQLALADSLYLGATLFLYVAARIATSHLD